MTARAEALHGASVAVGPHGADAFVIGQGVRADHTGRLLSETYGM